MNPPPSSQTPARVRSRWRWGRIVLLGIVAGIGALGWNQYTWRLHLRGCLALQNVDGLQGLTALEVLYLRDCPALQNVDGLKGLTTLRELDLRDCPKLPPEQVAALRAALPNASIDYP